ncbi:hypothetical protein E2C01_041918 [Portunus trituberculatus]|uniref:Uncharacterized protein n=1 Tax=Portunus trituberculatus TaxID=210409 RepID=A0A5B7FNS8_PORTR|nr:hypothetical protein [Portunus trituberculatus]
MEQGLFHGWHHKRGTFQKLSKVLQTLMMWSHPPAMGQKQPTNDSLDTTAEPASTGAHLALTMLGMQDVPAKTSRGTLVEPRLAETVGPLP